MAAIAIALDAAGLGLPLAQLGVFRLWLVRLAGRRRDAAR